MLVEAVATVLMGSLPERQPWRGIVVAVWALLIAVGIVVTVLVVAAAVA